MIDIKTKVRDELTGFEGMVSVIAKFDSGAKVLVESVDDTGRPIERWFNESRLIKVEDSDN